MGGLEKQDLKKRSYSIIFGRTGIFTQIMGYAKERGKLEKLLTKTVGLDIYNEKNLAVLVDSHEKYSHTVRILKNKEPDTFGDLYKNELQDIKEGKKSLKESESDEVRQNNFILYKQAIVQALEKTIKTTQESL
jgi:hypothetical protein